MTTVGGGAPDGALEREITAQTCPRWESSVAHGLRAQAIVHRVVQELDAADAARVERQRAAAQAAREVEERKVAAAKQHADSVSHGRQYADRLLREVAVRDRLRIRPDIVAVLEAEVEADWDTEDVENLVEERLDEWATDEDDSDG